MYHLKTILIQLIYEEKKKERKFGMNLMNIFISPDMITLNQISACRTELRLAKDIGGIPCWFLKTLLGSISVFALTSLL